MARIRLSPTALSDLRKIKEYISENHCDPIAAERTIERIVDDYTRLEFSPNAAPLFSSVFPIKTDYRFLVSGGYIVFYKTEGEYVSVYRVLYGRRDCTKILFKDAGVEDEEK